VTAHRSGVAPSRVAGLALLRDPFRPFFLASAIWAAFALVLLLLMRHGTVGLPSALAPGDWHTHEMLFGYVSGVVGGFLLTAVPKWTGRAPLTGAPLLVLVGVWIAGRLALASSAIIGLPISASIDAAFLPAVCVIVLVDIVVTRTWRDLRVLAPAGVLAFGNVIFHVAPATGGAAGFGVSIGLAATILMIVVLGGRIVPGYTRTLLARRDLLRGTAGRLPRPYSRFDDIAILLAISALAAWIGRPASPITAALLLASAAVQLVRCLRWAGDRVRDNRVVLILHLGYGFVALGFALAGLAALRPATIPPSAAVHAWTAGAIGVMTLGVMTHLTLRHTEGRLAVSRATEIACGAAVLAAAGRVIAPIVASDALMLCSGILWVAAFAGFALAHGPRLSRPRRPLKDVP
jgi:uncharacterized protein involved in response to NO